MDLTTLQYRYKWLNELSLQQYIDYAREFFTKRNYFVFENKYRISFFGGKTSETESPNSNGIIKFIYCYDTTDIDGDELQYILEIDSNGLVFKEYNVITNDVIVIEQYEFPQAQLLMNVFFNR